MLDTVGPELQVVNKAEKSVALEADSTVILTPFEGQEASSEVLPINFDGLAKVLNSVFSSLLCSILFPIVCMHI